MLTYDEYMKQSKDYCDALEIIKQELAHGSCEEETLLKSLRILNTILPKEIAQDAGCTAVVRYRHCKRR